MLKLSIEDDEGKTTVVPLTRDEMTVGRQEGNTIRLTERNVSRRHARLLRQNGTLCIEDLSSFTGVRVNGTKIVSPTPLREGDEVQIGDYRITLRGERPPVTDRPTMPTMPVVNGPIGSVGGAVAIPTRASVAAMAAQPASQAAANAAVPAPRSRTKTSPPQPMTAMPPEGAGAAAVAPAPSPEEPVVQAVEAQPTIPLRALTDQGLDPTPAAGPPARLVVMTTDLAGREVALDKASLVIGRTDENDVVLNHRSISRHHAKLVRDGDRYTIVDLQSANGVRVNGEDYERIELNPGDLLELGHVKLRFVGPLEQFAFDGRMASPSRRPPASLLAMGGGAVAAIAVVALLWHRGGHRGAEVAPAPAVAAAPAAPPPEPAEAPVAQPPVTPPPAPARPAPSVPATPAALLASAKEKIAAEDWEAAETALVKIDAAAADAATRREAAALIRKVETERQGAALFARFDAAANEKDYAAAVAGYAEIPADSLYKKRARPRYEEARALLIAQHMTAAEAARAEGRCADVRVEAAQVLRLDPKNLLIRDLSKLCRARPDLAAATVARPVRTRQVSTITAADRGEAPRRPEAAKGDGAEPAAKAEAADPDDAEALMKQAREAWLRQQCGAAMDLSRRALKAKPGWTDAYQILAVCSCSLKDAEAAEHAYARLDDRNRSLVHAVCQKNGISVGQ
ncbi:MAG TPA: FHA domain-containing protein [Polyangia bacterium]|nr:FHA domain-containing protein [Polyangia bacterium]